MNSAIKILGAGLLASAFVSANVSADGEADYKTICFSCHDGGIAGAPKLGDKDAWASRIAKGTDTLYQSVLDPAGFKGETGFMPPRGGSALSDDALKGVVDFMIKKSQ